MPGPGPRPAADAGPEITYAECRQCGTLIAGLDGRYSCGVCGWVNHHSEGHRQLPRPEDDIDHAAAGSVGNRLGAERRAPRRENRRSGASAHLTVR